MNPLKVFIGYDSRETVAYHVLSHSIQSRASKPVMIAPVALDQLKGVYTRPRGPTESTEFSLSRFLVPYLSSFEGMSVFMDCDMLCRADLYELLEDVVYPAMNASPGYRWPAVWAAQHNYVPKDAVKFLGNPQTAYPRKNWSSLMVFDNARCSALTPDYVNSASGLELHRFMWLPSTEPVGELPLEWNWLVGEYERNPKAKMLHYTLGGPWFEGYEGCDHADEWFAERVAMNRAVRQNG